MCRPSWTTPAFLGDARSLGLSGEERLAIVTWIAANPQAGDGAGHSSILAQYGEYSPDLRVQKGVAMKKTKQTAGGRMVASAKEALAFAKGLQNHGCEVHVPNDIDVKAIRERISLSQGEFAKLFGLSKRTLEHWEHGRRVPSGPARAFLIVIAREPDAVRRALLA